MHFLLQTVDDHEVWIFCGKMIETSVSPSLGESRVEGLSDIELFLAG